MSREAYAPPSQTATLPFFSTATTTPEGAAAALTQYLCGDCNSKVQLKKGDPIRCKECGHRVLYKERTKRYVRASPTPPHTPRGEMGTDVGFRMVQFEAR